MKQVRQRRRSRPIVLSALLAVVASMLVVASSPAQAAEYDDLLTDNVVEINETVSDAGFVHPGVGLSADDLRNAQEMVRTGQEPWASYFDAMTKVGAASKTYRASNSEVRGRARRGARPELRPRRPARPRDRRLLRRAHPVAHVGHDR